MYYLNIVYISVIFFSPTQKLQLIKTGQSVLPSYCIICDVCFPVLLYKWRVTDVVSYVIWYLCEFMSIIGTDRLCLHCQTNKII